MKREIHPKLSKNVGAINSCRSLAVSLPGAAVGASGGGAGHRAKPVLNALLNFTNLRRAVNHLGGSTGLGCWSCRIGLVEVPAELPRWDLPRDPLVCFSSLPNVFLFIRTSFRLPTTLSRKPIDLILPAFPHYENIIPDRFLSH